MGTPFREYLPESTGLTPGEREFRYRIREGRILKNIKRNLVGLCGSESIVDLAKLRRAVEKGAGVPESSSEKIARSLLGRSFEYQVFGGDGKLTISDADDAGRIRVSYFYIPALTPP